MGIFWATFSLPVPTADPLFTGPPEFIVLSLIVALGLYLRQVNVHALESIDKIRHREIWKTPIERKYAAEKMKQLERTSDTIIFVSPFMICLSLVVGLRITADAILRFSFDARHPPRLVYATDLIIAFWLLATLLGLARAHFDARNEDNRLRRRIRSEEGKAEAAQSSIDAQEIK
jgi:hypothetical protein